MGARRYDRVAAVVEQLVRWTRVLAGARAEVGSAPFEGTALTSTQREALFLIAHDPTPTTPGALASALAVTPGAVTQLVDGLRRERLVEQTPHPSDARSRVLTLTPDATARLAMFEQSFIRVIAPRFNGLDDDELTTLTRLMRKAGF
ncbi:MarR family transcriptional regulator [Microbacterium protaetiae]|uniref:MarR family transcriptional regulator n=1 Tax=Microbacterium protaetiae TaxID=2509458 RepID=A0A4P6EAI2_9MICO|nr:MarR family transcriptional regulator [Microbacterium protaetiae]QAY58974.1 MarR family transcriptional regulator [Microbacterium protaetiae]